MRLDAEEVLSKATQTLRGSSRTAARSNTAEASALVRQSEKNRDGHTSTESVKFINFVLTQTMRRERLASDDIPVPILDSGVVLEVGPSPMRDGIAEISARSRFEVVVDATNRCFHGEHGADRT